MQIRRWAALGGMVLALWLVTEAQAQTVFMVQLGTFRTDKEANAQWDKLTQDFPDLFEPLTYTPTEITLPPDDFIYHRNQAGPIPTRSEAEEICGKLLAKNYECYVVETAMFTAPTAPGKSKVFKEAQQAKADAEPVPETVEEKPEQKSTADRGIFSYFLSDDEEKTPQPLTRLEKTEAPAPAAPSADAASLPEPLPPLEMASNEAAPSPAAPANADAASLQNQVAAPAPAAPMPPPPPVEAAPASVPVPVAAPPAPPAPPAAPVETMVPMVPETAPDNRASVQVGEAIPVPLSAPEMSSSRGAPVAAVARPNVFLGYPSQLTRGASLWAEINSFKTEQAALGYWNTLRNRDTQLPNGLRLRVTRPYYIGRAAAQQKLSLRVGPFSNVMAIRKLCGLTRPEQLTCRAIKDLGSSVNTAGLTRQRSYQARINRQQLRQYARPATQGFGSGGLYWIQLGSFMAPAAAQDKWQELAGSYGNILSHTSHQIYVPNRTSGSALYRLRAGPYSMAGDAVSTCEALKSQGAICAVVKD